MPQVFHVGVKGVIVNDKKVLLLKRLNELGQLYWDFPGGRIDDGETIDETLKRELKEEVGLTKFKNGGFLHFHHLKRLIYGKWGLIILFYLVEAPSDFTPKLSDEHIEPRWVGLSEIKYLDKEVLFEKHTEEVLIKVLR